MRQGNARNKAKHEIIQHLHNVGAEKGYNSQMSFDFDAITLGMLKKFGCTTSITGRILNDLERTYLGFFSGAKGGCFLMHEEDIEMFIELIMGTNSAYGLINMDDNHREDQSFLGENHRYVYNKKLVLLLDGATTAMLANAGRLMPNPFLFSMLPMLLNYRGKDDSFLAHIQSLESLMLMNLKITR